MTAPSPSMSLQIGQQLGSYEVTSLLGKGGMGEVYKARDTRLNRRVGAVFALVPIGAASVGCGETLIESCEHCNAEGADIPFDNILDRLIGSDPSVTDYLLERPAKCPTCHREISEKTLVEPSH